MRFFIIILFLFFNSLSQELTNTDFYSENYQVKSPHIPQNLLFCNEKVPIKNQDILERFDKEILVNTYYHSKAILILKRSNKYFPVIEKHLKINQSHRCVDSPVSITGEQMKKLKEELNKIKIIINKPKFGIRESEKGTVIFKRKKIY